MLRVIDPTVAGVTEPFPVYDQLLTTANNHIRTGAPTVEQWSKWVSVIVELPDDYLSMIYALILHHGELEHRIRGGRSRGDASIPYGGRTFDFGKGVTFQGCNLPPVLQWIVGSFVDQVVA